MLAVGRVRKAGNFIALIVIALIVIAVVVDFVAVVVVAFVGDVVVVDVEGSFSVVEVFFVFVVGNGDGFGVVGLHVVVAWALSGYAIAELLVVLVVVPQSIIFCVVGVSL